MADVHVVDLAKRKDWSKIAEHGVDGVNVAPGTWRLDCSTPADRKVAEGDDGSGAERRGTVTLLSEVATTPVSRVTSDTRLRYRIMQD